MSKTVELQIEKSRSLIEGLRSHLSEGIKGGITSQHIDEMEKGLHALMAANEECDRLRAELTPKVRQMNKILAEVKTAFIAHKKVIKGQYPQEQWAAYGVPDKR